MSGNISDMKEVKSEIVELSEFPVSIVIVGVGDSDFTKMIELDSDSEILRDHNGVCA